MRLEVLIEGEIMTALASFGIGSFLCSAHDTGFLIVGYTLLEKVCLSSK